MALLCCFAFQTMHVGDSWINMINMMLNVIALWPIILIGYKDWVYHKDIASNVLWSTTTFEMAEERRDNIMSVELAIQREEAYRRKLSKLQLNLDNDLMPLEVRIQTDGWIIFLFLNQCSFFSWVFFFFFFPWWINHCLFSFLFSLRHPKVKTDSFSGFHCEYLFSLLENRLLFKDINDLHSIQGCNWS